MRSTESEQPHKTWLEPLTIILAALIISTALFISRADDEAPRHEVVAVPGLLPAGVPFTPAVRAGGLIFLSGQVGIRPGSFELVDGGIEAEARQTMENIGQVLVAAGAGFDDIVKCPVFLRDIADWAVFNEVYSEHFPDGPPARSAFAASGLVLGAAAEVDCIAAEPDDD
jgi:2-iminobutanoate/2-iminopropanoate deaminase